MAASKEYLFYAVRHPLETAGFVVGTVLGGAALGDGIHRHVMLQDPLEHRDSAMLYDYETVAGLAALAGVVILGMNAADRIKQARQVAQVAQEAERYTQEAAPHPHSPTDL